MKRRVLVLAIFLAAIAPARASFDEGLAAYHRGEYVAASREFPPAAHRGQASARFYFGRMYAIDRGVARDHAQAHMWHNAAAANALPGAVRNLAARARQRGQAGDPGADRAGARNGTRFPTTTFRAWALNSGIGDTAKRFTPPIERWK